MARPADRRRAEPIMIEIRLPRLSDAAPCTDLAALVIRAGFLPVRRGVLAEPAPLLLDGGDERALHPHAHGAGLHGQRLHRQPPAGYAGAALLQARPAPSPH